MSFQLCATEPLPSFNSIYNNLKSQITYPPTPFVFPTLPTIPSPLYSSIRNPNLELVAIASELQSFQLMNTFMSVINPIVQFLSLGLDSFLPKISGMDINLLNLLSIDASSLYQKMKDMLPDITLPYVSLPILNSLSIPDFELKNKVTLLIKGYLINLIPNIVGIINSVTGILHLSALPSLPHFPTMEELKNIMLNKFPSVPDIKTLLSKGISLVDIFDFDIPGFPKFSFPSPLIPNFSSIEVEFTELINILYNEMILTPMKIIVDFCKNVLGMLGFTFPTFCITL